MSRIRLFQILIGVILMASLLFGSFSFFLPVLGFSVLCYSAVRDLLSDMDEFRLLIDELPITSEQRDDLVFRYENNLAVSIITPLVGVRQQYPDSAAKVNRAISLVENRLPSSSFARRFLSRRQVDYVRWSVAAVMGAAMLYYAIDGLISGSIHVVGLYGTGFEISGWQRLPHVVLFALFGVFLMLTPFYESYGHSFKRIQKFTFQFEVTIVWCVLLLVLIRAYSRFL